MKRYTIYCTKEQSEKAYKLGAPISSGNDFIMHNDNDDTNCLYTAPTAEQMCSWLRENGYIVFVHGLNDGYEWVVESKHGLDRGEKNNYEEAIHEAIDLTLDYISDGVVTEDDTIDEIPEELIKMDDYVDLGLSVKWAKCNIGATSEEEYGDYFTFDNACKYFNDREDRMPCKKEFKELLSGTTQEIVEVNGVKGTKFTSKINNNYIFVPFTGCGTHARLDSVGDYSYLWSSSIDGSRYAWGLISARNGNRGMSNYGYRYSRFSVRGVSE